MHTIQPDQYEQTESKILSGEIPEGKVPDLLDANPTFARWYARRVEARQSNDSSNKS